MTGPHLVTGRVKPSEVMRAIRRLYEIHGVKHGTNRYDSRDASEASLPNAAALDHVVEVTGKSERAVPVTHPHGNTTAR